MPPATGFQYTPPSYLVRAGDSTNRPWSRTEEGEGGHENEYVGDNEYDLPQEERPQTRRSTHLDAHFQQRVRNKTSRYRDILKGEAEFVDESKDEDGYNADSYTNATKLNIQSKEPTLAEQKSSSIAADAEKVRNLRAHRLRANMRQTNDEYEIQEKLEARRRKEQEAEALAKKAERDANDPVLQKLLERERIAKEEAQRARIRAGERQREREKLEEQRKKLQERYRKQQEKDRQRREMRTKRGDWIADFDTENDFPFLGDISGMIRDSGLVKSCGSCFAGANDAVDDATLQARACAALSFLPGLAPDSDTSGSEDGMLQEIESAKRTREYALYRE